MVVSVNSNIITVVSDIPMTVVEKGYTDLTAYDEKKNPLYTVKINKDGTGNLSQFGLVANAVVDGKAAVVIVEKLDITEDEIKHKYGKAVVAASKFCPIIANAAVTEEEMIELAFGATLATQE